MLRFGLDLILILSGDLFQRSIKAVSSAIVLTLREYDTFVSLFSGFVTEHKELYHHRGLFF